MLEKRRKDESIAEDKGVDVMPMVDVVEGERSAYVKELEEYLNKLKQMPVHEAKQRSRSNLISSKIIQENGDFTEQYSYSSKRLKAKRKKHI